LNWLSANEHTAEGSNASPLALWWVGWLWRTRSPSCQWGPLV